jgi:hypothetical protein
MEARIRCVWLSPWSLASVRWTFSILLLLIASGWLACRVDVPASSSASRLAMSQWRHTARGWERLIPEPTLQPDDDLWARHPHPVVLTLLEGMLSVFALVAFSPVGKSNRSYKQNG